MGHGGSRGASTSMLASGQARARRAKGARVVAVAGARGRRPRSWRAAIAVGLGLPLVEGRRRVNPYFLYRYDPRTL
jgi:hypothetical protein